MLVVLGEFADDAIAVGLALEPRAPIERLAARVGHGENENTVGKGLVADCVRKAVDDNPLNTRCQFRRVRPCGPDTSRFAEDFDPASDGKNKFISKSRDVVIVPARGLEDFRGGVRMNRDSHDVAGVV